MYIGGEHKAHVLQVNIIKKKRKLKRLILKIWIKLGAPFFANFDEVGPSGTTQGWVYFDILKIHRV